MALAERASGGRGSDFFLTGVVESARESVELAGSLLALRETWQRRFHAARSSALLLKLIDNLFHMPYVTIARAADFLKVTPAAASGNITKLVEAGILFERTLRKRDQIFVAMDIIRIVENAQGASTPPAG